MQLVLHRPYLAESVGQTHVRPQPRNYVAEVVVMVLHGLGRHSRGVRNPELHLCIGISEPFRKHANQGVRFSVEMDLLADDRWVCAKPALKHAPAEHHCASVGAVLGFGEGPPDYGVHP